MFDVHLFLLRSDWTLATGRSRLHETILFFASRKAAKQMINIILASLRLGVKINSSFFDLAGCLLPEAALVSNFGDRTLIPHG